MQNNTINKLQKQPKQGWLIVGFWLLMMQFSAVRASDLAMTELNFSSLPGDKIQIQLSMNASAIAPKVFQTDNPARLALDFAGVKNSLDKKLYQVNQGAAGSIYVVEASGRTRVIINLTESVPYDIKVDGEKVYVVLKPVSSTNLVKQSTVREKVVDRRISNLLPKQTIKSIDFRRGPKGEGRILLGLSTPNTVVDVKEKGGKVILNFLNTTLPTDLVKSFDVADFATPVRKIDAKPRGAGVSVIVTPVDGNYEYSSYQSDGLLIVDFAPMSKAEKKAKLKEKFPYSGKKLTFNFQDIEVRSVLQILADFTGLNIIAADTVNGNVTLRLNDVPWDQALDLILKSKGLSKRKSGNVVLVAPTAEIIKIEQDELAAKEVIEQLEPLKTEYIQINYAKAEEIQALLVGANVTRTESSNSKSSGANIFGGANSTASRSSKTKQKTETKGVLSYRGSSTVDARTNTLIVKDTVKQLVEVRKMIELLDIPVRQVMIEARIVVANTGFAQEIGVRFGVAKAHAVGGGLFALGGEGTEGDIVTGTRTVNNTMVDLAATAMNAHPVGALGTTLVRAADYVLNLELSALQNDDKGEVLANPRIMTSDRELAFIKQGIQIPYESNSGDDGTTTELIDAVLELNVTPQITPDGDVIMELLIKKDNPQPGTDRIEKRELETIVRVKNGETVVLGGIFEGTSSKITYKIPFFADLPLIGWLFTKNILGDTKTELLVFVTPKIVKDTLAAR
ncbi:MAG: type IV pilus secretin PilQ [Methylococcales bacterium]|nr:type IV pilus secretin PilQ [Methylococcales bacterium]